ncbi:3'(2'),5'-bisphosphate nucleotidase CysQ [Shewanella intestini]|uniref:3'(2'),5'-bisphosphate nucleotidase CysQ n=1 Tax=Shewanella intestini TaxID=2017544 RepID=A0ABS5I5Q6_9GAMM|nr:MULTISPECIES: 3'(2'),5'-bisphosphate nucleotidase CysQ [Shewanella]MBR9729358.1 3'(2'),5'-bisphosphate nucleotidase CysQ [Shewanella intestini]MRG37437.1 3'(2'),5'-bisphosphate nucleotidase CysQ [Shewanella sp. XMDDZSB0408]
MKPEDIIEQIIDIATQAGQEIRSIYQNGNFEREIKSDNTPVTSADLAANEIICRKLAELTPDIPILSEEAVNIPLSDRQHWQRYWLVDPLDGTGEFIAGSGDFSVIIALVEHNRPIVGVVYVPMTQVCYYAIAGLGAYKRDNGQELRIKSNSLTQQQTDQLRVAVSRRQDPKSVLKLFNHAKHCELVVLGGAALKSCLVAEGRADCYVRLGPTGEWDTGAAQIIVEEAGGALMDINLQPMSYNERETLENPNFIVVGSPNLAWDEILTQS